MKRLIICLAALAMLSTTIGCANGPVRSFLRNTLCNQGCEAPAADPSYGFGFNQSGSLDSDCATGNCGVSNGGLVSTPIDQGGIQGAPIQSQVQGQAQGDPYIYGSNYGSATINPPVFDNYSGPSYGGTIGSSNSNGMLPTPSGG